MIAVRSLPVVFHKGPSRRYRSVLVRPDGVEIELDGGGYNDVGGPAGEVPHDIAHLVVEDELALDRGVWGVLAAGGLFRGAAVRAGRRPPHDARRAREILRTSVEPLNQAEILVRVVCDAARSGERDPRALRAATGPRWWSDAVTAGALDRAAARLHAAGADWAALAPGGTLPLTWPHAR